ncbi:MAG: FlgD immunoglobulin-like domain containing protein, partial [Candidatus Cloacimonadaceae bacterium]
QPDMFGFMVDDIAFGGYSNNGVDDGQMTWSSLVPLGGQLWHVATDTTAPSPTHIMKNQNTNGTYNPNMYDYIISPSITLPNSGDIRADFMIMGNFEDPDYSSTAPLSILDYWGWEISPDNGNTWTAMSNPYADPNGNNYVYVDAPDAWISAVSVYSLDGYISDFAGQTVKFRWYFKSDGDAPQGTGIMIDDFTIYNDIFIAPPEDLLAEVVDNDVTLSWNAPGSGGGGGEEGWIHYDGDNYDAIGTDDIADFSVAAKWDPLGEVNSIYPYVGMNITKIQFWPNEANCEYSVRLWTGGAATLVVDQAVPTVTIGAWNEITLATPYTIPASTAIWAGYRCNTQAGHPAGIDDGSATVEGYGNWINMGSWSTLTSMADIQGNWNIRVYVADAEGREYVLGELPETPGFANGEFTRANLNRNHRDVGSYKIYRDGVFVSEVPGTVTQYTDTDVPGGAHNYYVTAMYDGNESTASNTQVVFIIPEDHVEAANDDGTAEAGLNVGSSRQMAVLHSEYSGSPVTIKYVKIYVETLSTAQFVIRIFEKDPTTGLPGNLIGDQIQFPAASVVSGWNYITVPGERVAENGEFFIGLLETPNHSAIGVDTSTNGFSYTNLGSGWNVYEDGEIMIRAIVQVGSSNPEGVSPVLTLSASNYPNPFNPETTISFTVPQNGQTSVKIFNLKGQEVRSLLNKEMPAGSSTIVWNGTDDSGKNVASGLYFVRVQNNCKAVTRKMLLSK